MGASSLMAFQKTKVTWILWVRSGVETYYASVGLN